MDEWKTLANDNTRKTGFKIQISSFEEKLFLILNLLVFFLCLIDFFLPSFFFHLSHHIFFLGGISFNFHSLSFIATF